MALNIVTRLLRRKDQIKLLCERTLVKPDLGLLNYDKRFYFPNLFTHHELVYNTKLNSSHLKFYSIKTAQQTNIEDYRNEHNITIVGEDAPDPYTEIEKSGFPNYIKSFLKDQGFTKPTVIQSQGWPIALNGQNFVGIAQTGTGKTLAYLLPAVVHIKEKAAGRGLGPIALVLAPTRELARQIEQVAKDFEKSLNVRTVCIYGGVSRYVQAERLKRGVDILIATPGRLNDFLVSKVLSLSRSKYVVLDEADRMLDMGFEPQIRQALESVPKERQILMFSATWPMEVKDLAKEFLGDFVQVNVGSTELSANHNIKQIVHVCDQDKKMEKLKEIMHEVSEDKYEKMLLFTNTKKHVDILTNVLRRNGWPAVGIHGDKSQLQRDTIIDKFKSGDSRILVATDVAARGLDVDGVTHVLNYDFPNTSADYIHRIGRTGRHTNKGVSHTILTDENARQAKGLIEVMREANQEIPRELLNLASFHDLSKANDRQAKWKPKYGNNNNYNNRSYRNNYQYNNNNNRYRNQRRNRYDDEEYY